MAKGRGGKSSTPAASKLRKSHGPKRHMFKEFKPLIKAMADAGLLTKYNNFESWQLACQACGKRNASRAEFNAFVALSLAEKKQYFKDLRDNK